MASIKYGPLDPSPKTHMYPVAASQYFYHEGANFVYLDSSGNVCVALTATATLFGYAIVPKGRGAGTSDNYWLSSATAAADRIPIVLAKDGYEFLCPGIITCTAAMTGGAWDIVAVNDGTATYVDLDTSTTDVVIVTDLGVNRHAKATAYDSVCIINPAKIQADT